MSFIAKYNFFCYFLSRNRWKIKLFTMKYQNEILDLLLRQ